MIFNFNVHQIKLSDIKGIFDFIIQFILKITSMVSLNYTGTGWLS